MLWPCRQPPKRVWLWAASVVVVAGHVAQAALVSPTVEADVQGVTVPHGGRCMLSHVATAHPRRLVVVATGGWPTGGTTWMDELLPHTGFVTYSASSEPPSHPASTVVQRVPIGNEAGAFVQYVLDNWDCLPDASLLLHHHRYDGHGLRYLVPLGVGTSSNVGASIPGLPIWRTPDMVEWARRFCWADTQGYWPVSPLDTCLPPRYLGLAEPMAVSMWEWIRADTDPQQPVRLCFHCCGQFVVTRAAVRRRGLGFWTTALRDLARHRNSTVKRASYWVGRAYEHLWDHIFFANDASLRRQLNTPDARRAMFACGTDGSTDADVRPAQALAPDVAAAVAALPTPAPTPSPLPWFLPQYPEPAGCDLGLAARSGRGQAPPPQCCRQPTAAEAGRVVGTVVATVSESSTHSQWFKHSHKYGWAASGVVIPPPVGGSKMWHVQNTPKAVCPRGGHVTAVLQGVLGTLGCVAGDHVALMWEYKLTRTLYEDAGLAFPLTLQAAGAEGSRPGVWHFLHRVCLSPDVHYRPVAERPSWSTAKGAVLDVMQEVWRGWLHKALPPDRYEGDGAAYMQRFPYHRSLQAVVSSRRLLSVPQAVWERALADVCHRATTPWEAAVAVEAYERLLSVVIATHRERLRSFPADEAAFACNNTASAAGGRT